MPPVTQAVIHLPWPIFVGVVAIVILFFLVRLARSQ
jgi:hypothetical protein